MKQLGALPSYTPGTYYVDSESCAVFTRDREQTLPYAYSLAWERPNSRPLTDNREPVWANHVRADSVNQPVWTELTAEECGPGPWVKCMGVSALTGCTYAARGISPWAGPGPYARAFAGKLARAM